MNVLCIAPETVRLRRMANDYGKGSARRSEAARKGWQTRKRRMAALKAAETRRRRLRGADGGAKP